MNAPLLSREAFREAVFARDGHRCVFCERAAQDAHHILERRLWADGGYYRDNGASVCAEHHLACERTQMSVEEVRNACGINRILVPEHLYDDHVYDKWGNPIFGGGRRGRGELFFDPSVQKVLAEGGVLPLFTPYVKYPRTHHLPWSPGMHEDDRRISSLEGFAGEEVVVTEKMDGENTTLYRDHIHARSLDSRGGEDRAWVKQRWSQIAHEIPQDWRLCGENLWARHSIVYHALPSYFLGFSLWNERNECLSWDETLDYFELLGIRAVPVLYRGPFEEKRLRALEKTLHFDRTEGYVVRVARSFPYGAFRRSIAKFVRAGHVQTTRHWRAGAAFTPNRLALEHTG